MKNLASIIALTASLVSGQAAAQTSTYYARSVIAPADEKAAPVPMQSGTPATTPSGSGAWTVGSWSASSSRCSTSAVQTRAVECVVAGVGGLVDQGLGVDPARVRFGLDLLADALRHGVDRGAARLLAAQAVEGGGGLGEAAGHGDFLFERRLSSILPDDQGAPTGCSSSPNGL